MWTKLADIAEEVEFVNPRIEPNKEFTYLDIASIDNKQQKITSPKRYVGKDAPSRARQLVKAGDILFSTVRTYLKNVAMVDEMYQNQIASTGFCVIRSCQPISRRFLFYFVQTDYFLNPLNQIQRGTSYPAVRDSDVFVQYVPLAPVAEQHLIVNKVEELFTRLDAGIDALKKAREQLKHYRQAVLKFAFEGKLTLQWRKENRDKIEPALVLLERIREERISEAKAKLKELPPLETKDLPELPSAWKWARACDIFRIVDYRGRTPPFSPMGIPHLRSSNIREGKIIWNGLKYISPETYEKYMTRGLPQEGDLLFTSEAPLGEVALAPELKFSVAQRIMILRPLGGLDSKFLLYQIMTERFQNRLKGRGTGTTVTGISSRNFKPAELAIAPILEQRKIVEEIERGLSIADQTASVVEQSLKQVHMLRQTVLKSAFEGKLVPQDPTDEPASVLLERIKTYRGKIRSEQDANSKNKKQINVKQMRLI